MNNTLGLNGMKLHGVYTADDLGVALRYSDPIDNPQFVTHKHRRLMILRTNRVEVVFEVLTGGRLHLVEKNLLH